MISADGRVQEIALVPNFWCRPSRKADKTGRNADRTTAGENPEALAGWHGRRDLFRGRKADKTGRNADRTTGR